MNMLNLKLSLLIVSVAATSAFGAPLDRRTITPDAKWLVHLDVDQLRQSQLGHFVLDTMMAPHFAEIQKKSTFDLHHIIDDIHGITAYGSDFNPKQISISPGDAPAPGESGVLLVNIGSETEKVVDGLISMQLLAQANGPLQQVQTTPYPIYSFQGQVYVSPHHKGIIVVSKSLEMIKKADGLINGHGASLASGKHLNDPSAVGNPIFTARSEGTVSELTANNPAAAAMVPNFPQASVLKMTDGGSISVGEIKTNLTASIRLTTKTPDVARQIQQVLEGMIALFALGQSQNPDVVQFVNSAKVKGEDRAVSITVAFPTDKVLAQVQQQMQKSMNNGRPKKNRHEEVDPAAENAEVRP